MTDRQPGGNVEGRDIFAHTINTGRIEHHTHLTIKAIVADLDKLAALLADPEGQVSLSDEQTLIARAGSETLSLPPALLTAWQLLPQAIDASPDLRQRAYAAWLATRQPVDPIQEVAARDHYIPLAGRVDRRDMPLTLRFSERRWVGEGPTRQIERVPLADVTEAVAEHPAFVLLGPPGSGKSTVLRRLALQAARAYLTGQSRCLPLRVNLANYRLGQADPLTFLRGRWAAELGGNTLPGADLPARIRAGEILILADGFNEMERLADDGQRRRRANLWREFAADYFADPANPSRLLIASRDQADYDQPLGLPRVEIDFLSEEQIAAFLAAYLGQDGQGALAALQRLDLLEHARNPYQLFVLAALYNPQTGDLPPNRGRLFAEYAARLVGREEGANHPHWIRAEVQLAALSVLGFAMQARSESTLLNEGEVQELLPERLEVAGRLEVVKAADLLDLACRAAILTAEGVAAERRYRFSHQLLQEQFAARHMLARWQIESGPPLAEEAEGGLSDLWRVPRTRREMPPVEGGEWDPLPPPPAGGWEQTTLLAAGLTGRPDPFVRAVLAANPALAGRCLSEGLAPVSAETRGEVQQALLADLGDAALHRRARIQAGRILGAVGDPRFARQEIGGLKVILPELVYVPGGQATLGSRGRLFDRQAYDDERPRCRVAVNAFYLGRYPVSNAEYACFIEAGGYDGADYWTPDGWRWRQGELEESGPLNEALELRAYYVQNPEEIDKAFREGRITPDVADGWRTLIQLSEDEIRRQLGDEFGPQVHEQPYYWDDPAYNGPNQPVVGVTWYEAMAYCAWLNWGIGERGWGSGDGLRVWGEGGEERLEVGPGRAVVRLPTEAEWEWAAGGPGHRRYPWGGRFDSERANTLEGRVLGTSPLGAYPAGAAACGAFDLCGNVWEWTASLYQPYPYRAADGREDPLPARRRALRGGSWAGNRWHARVSYRDRHGPVDFDFDLGFRCVVAPV